MNRNRTAKADTVEDLKNTLTEQSIAVVVHSTGLSAGDTLALRNKIRAAGASYRVAKNTLVRLALKGTAFEGLSQLMKGPTALAYGKDPVAAAKAIVEFAKGNDKLKLIGANLNGEMLDVKATQTLASLPPLNELRARIIGMIQTPATRIAGILQAPAGQLARVVAAKSRQGA
jgi:large subunit ribosomal protein L10